ncbi:hypothetical protein ACWER9_29250, partial [Micromonospora sp. NPDC003944]
MASWRFVATASWFERDLQVCGCFEAGVGGSLGPVLPYTSMASIALRLIGVCLLTAGAVLLFGW